jgi:UDP-glucose 4-epimerase
MVRLRPWRQPLTRVLVTGGMGFIGTSVVSRLARKRPVTVGDRLDFGVPGAVRTLIETGTVEMSAGDLTHPSALHDRLASGAFDVVVHLAALHYIPACEARPLDAYRDNIQSTVALLAHCPAGTRFLNLSSAAVYRPSDVPHSEGAALGPTDVYGWTKKQGEEITSYFARARRLSAINIRLFNAVGPGETNPHVLPNLLLQVAAGATSLELGNLFPRRDFIHIEDIAWVISGLINEWPAADGEALAVNVGSGAAVSVQEILERVAELVGRPLTAGDSSKWRRDVERPFLAADISQLRLLLPRFRPTPVDEWLPPLVADPAVRIAIG